ncbi:DJ-1/YajL/PfpI superfamily, includes chaperone protein YajL (former ThiJ), parkinsonism-associated protein DJ-1, peptidases PfpI, Hsp31 [hydrothermal vent metagenome]|uniref:DJ-1/YajL/PfpI superfamily, includes chaperone protein YajL (Former ThiJ), parkinsonism-associated protein DJ-1, peptidases PfpI, Hsp31 n=1 Tax=hydrothermal vent metagenome TaxID=652676 RepID=A0A1W1BSA6_9ZZZZ
MKKVLLPLAEGFEEIEAVSLIDIMRRGGIDVTTICLTENSLVLGANNIKIEADTNIDNINPNDFDMIVLPGGWGGTNILAEDVRVQNILKLFKKENRYIGAMCAAPYALYTADVLNHNYTCYPSVEEKIRLDGYISDKKVVIDDKVITSRGPATAICFALEIIKVLVGEDNYQAVKNGTLSDFC